MSGAQEVSSTKSFEFDVSKSAGIVADDDPMQIALGNQYLRKTTDLQLVSTHQIAESKLSKHQRAFEIANTLLDDAREQFTSGVTHVVIFSDRSYDNKGEEEGVKGERVVDAMVIAANGNSELLENISFALVTGDTAEYERLRAEGLLVQEKVGMGESVAEVFKGVATGEYTLEAIAGKRNSSIEELKKQLVEDLSLEGLS